MRLLKQFFLLLRDAGVAFAQDRASLYAAGLAYYTIFSIAPLLVLLVAVAGLFVDRALAREQLLEFVQILLGSEAADFVFDLALRAVNAAMSRTATIISLIALLYGAGSIFNQLRLALNLIWRAPTQLPAGLRGIVYGLRSRLMSFVMVFLLGGMLILSIVLDVILGFIGEAIRSFMPQAATLLPSISPLLSLLLAFLTILVIFKTLPDMRLRWRDASVGASLTALLFSLGVVVISRFLVLTGSSSLYGAAGSLIVLLVWVYYSAQIVLYGAEFTRLFAERYGEPIRPDKALANAQADAGGEQQ
jgi:membrane protein